MKIPSNIDLGRDGQYCIKCFSGPIERVFKGDLMYYKCSACGETSERSLVIDHNVVSWEDKERTYWHESVGVVVINSENKMLCILRKIYPFAYSIPAGHLDTNEKPDKAAQRELAEETGISGIENFQLLKEFDLPGDSCRRGSDHHRWHLYRATVSGSPALQLSEEASSAKWFGLAELKELKSATYPLSYIINTFGELLFNAS